MRHAWFSRPYGTVGLFVDSLPSDKSLGYYQTTLRVGIRSDRRTAVRTLRMVSGLSYVLATLKHSLNCLIARWTRTRTLPSLWPAMREISR